MWHSYRYNFEVNIIMKKEIIFNILKNSDHSMTANEIYNKISENIDINLSTVYRTLNNFVKKGLLNKSIHQDKMTYFELTDISHKHYIVCDNCNTNYITQMCEIERIAKKINKETGFNITSHVLEFHGICSKCLKNAK